MWFIRYARYDTIILIYHRQHCDTIRYDTIGYDTVQYSIVWYECVKYIQHRVHWSLSRNETDHQVVKYTSSIDWLTDWLTDWDSCQPLGVGEESGAGGDNSLHGRDEHFVNDVLALQFVFFTHHRVVVTLNIWEPLCELCFNPRQL